MTGHSNASMMRLLTGWPRPFSASMLGLVVGLVLGASSTSRGQTAPPDSQPVRPERIDQVRDRIETIRRSAGPDRTLHVGSSSPVQPHRSTPADRRPWAERPRFQLDRARLRAVIEDVLAEQTSPQRAGAPLPLPGPCVCRPHLPVDPLRPPGRAARDAGIRGGSAHRVEPVTGRARAESARGVSGPQPRRPVAAAPVTGALAPTSQRGRRRSRP